MYYDYLLRSRYLAFQVRRERISERMKFLQDLVPGCSKVTGKAVMLDEIINYVQSLQRQVEVGTHHSHSCFLCFDRCYVVHSKGTKVLIPLLCSRRTSRQFVAVNSPFYLLSSWRFPMHIPIKKTAGHDQIWQFVWMYHVLEFFFRFLESPGVILLSWVIRFRFSLCVQFLSMKLAAVNPRLDFNVDTFLAKEVKNCCFISRF